MSRARTSASIIAAGLLAVAACGGADDDSSSATDTTSAATAATTTAATTAPDDNPTAAKKETGQQEPSATTAPATTTPPATTSPEETEEAPNPEPEEPPVNTSPDGIRLLDFEYQPVPAGEYRVETIGAPFTIEIPEGWWVQPNSNGQFVITDAASEGPGDRDIVMIRPSNLADPEQPGAPAEEQAGDWPLDDIDGWLAALIPGVVSGEPTDATLGGLDAVQFEVDITDDVECGEFFCVGFATNRLVTDMFFDRRTGYRVWWIDGGEESPIAVNIGDGTNPAFTERAQAVLDTMMFESIGPNPIPSEGDLWELGISGFVPAGSVTLPVGPGVTFEISEPTFIFQDDFQAGVTLDGPGESDIFFPDQAFDGEPLATVDDVIAVFERADGFTATAVGTREVGGYEAIEVEISGPPPGPDSVRLLGAAALPGLGWRSPPSGTLWIMETPDGLAVVTAEWFAPDFVDAAQALADEILDSIVIG